MAVTAVPYGNFLLGLGSGQFNFGSDTIKVALVTNSYVPNVDTHVYFSDITNEVSGAGYTAGGNTLSGLSWTYDSTNDRAVLAASPTTWTGASFTARKAIAYKSTGTASTSRLIGYIDFGVDKTLAAEDYQLSFSNGLVRIKSA